ncbi:DMT family transporter [Erwinia sp. JUb26]|uniref:DMT family transporter n=1 Tax=Erwinia sp. JUb26 TaxID=2485126 RepID=UPI000F48E607|nr:DMT family transporter [Erwinia sp. JUb26]ROR10009.1 EamA-like transporter family protein [Erwinia sp. JUb26]
MERTTAGWWSGLIGVMIFSGSLPATRVAVNDFSPLFLTSARATIAALLGGALLLLLRQRPPARSDMLPLLIVALGVVVGFPLLTALALRHISAGHSVVFIGLLPLSTALFGVLRGGERPRKAFWLFSLLGAAIVAGFAIATGQGGSLSGDLLMVASVIVCGLGYAEGAGLSRRLGGWQVISWALLLSLPLMAVIGLFSLPHSWSAISQPGWLSLGYVSLFSMLIGFLFWYRGLALGGIAGVSQLQLLQPFFGLLLAAALLHESIAWSMIACATAVILCVFGAKRYS